MSFYKTNAEGINEFSGLSNDPLIVLFNLCKDRYSHTLDPFVLFTDPVEYKRGNMLMKFIQDNNLGEVWKSESKLNPNSQRKLEVFIFSPNDDVLEPWLRAEDSRWKSEYAEYTTKLSKSANWIPFKFTYSVPGKQPTVKKWSPKSVIETFIKS